MEHPGEVWQEVGVNGESIGGVLPDDFDYSTGRILHGAVVMLYRYKDGGVEFLFQHRSKLLQGNPDKWDVSAGGHVNVSESQVEAVVREAKEEIGVELDKDKLEFGVSYFRWQVVTGLYFYDFSDREDEFSFDDKEVSEVRWVKYNELDKFWSELKGALTDDVVFRHYLDEWSKKALEKYRRDG